MKKERKAMPPDPLCFLFHAERLLLRPGAMGQDALPSALSAPFTPAGMEHDLGRYGERPCLACLENAPKDAGGLTPVDLRSAHAILGEALYLLAGKGRELIHWEEHSRYCPVCGAGTKPATRLSRQCPACGREHFPSITPAILALVRRKDSILLVRARSFTGPHYGLVAGFLEPGESLEECVQREVLEETGLTVTGIAYFGSQPWPFPSSLMAGFVMDCNAGEIRLQEEELSHAAFFSRHELPELPYRFSLAWRMIDSWRAGKI
jgi:NAD+ diphosphatase